MGKTTGFKEFERRLPEERPAAERLADYTEFQIAQDAEAARDQAGRCMDCGIPFCQQGCPLGNRIPDWNDLVWRDRWRQAWIALDSTNDFPEFTGRICPAPCEGACTLSIPPGGPSEVAEAFGAVTIEQIEREIIERAFQEGWVVPRPPTQRSGRTVGIVGSGPAGLAAAARLNAAGHAVTVYERDDRIGGLLRYGIPDFKLEKSVIDRRLALMEAEGVRFEAGIDVGVDPTWDALRDRHDALLIAIGARRPRDLDVPGRALGGVHFAMDFLEQQNRVVAGERIPEVDRIDAAGRRVIILGGGDTGSDCLGTSLRQGAAHVTQLELMPRPPEARAAGNPWPQYPMVFRTSSSQAEGGDRDFSVLTTEIVGADGHITGLRASRCTIEGGRISPIEGSEHEIPCDLLLLAMGFTGPETDPLAAQLGVPLDARGNVEADRRFATAVAGVYAAGDARRGQSLVVWAISEGREAARVIDADLRGELPVLPTRGVDAPFGGR
jgi:glutamate synthase (NADPH/NADH) small chain